MQAVTPVPHEVTAGLSREIPADQFNAVRGKKIMKCEI